MIPPILHMPRLDVLALAQQSRALTSEIEAMDSADSNAVQRVHERASGIAYELGAHADRLTESGR